MVHKVNSRIDTLCSWARHFTLTVPLPSLPRCKDGAKWELMDLELGVKNTVMDNIPSRGKRNILKLLNTT